MLLWEALRRESVSTPKSNSPEASPRVTKRLPYETRCAAITKSGRRCRGRILRQGEFCAFHDPDLVLKRRSAQLKPRSSQHRRLSHLPGGYLRKLTSRAAVGTAMDRLYREVRLGLVTPEMGRVLFSIVTRILDADLCNPHGVAPNGRARADRIRPKLDELLTRAERSAWRRAIANATVGKTHDSLALPDVATQDDARPSRSTRQPVFSLPDVPALPARVPVGT